MLKVKVGYPTREEEKVIIDRMSGRTSAASASKVVSPEQIARARERGARHLRRREGEGLHPRHRLRHARARASYGLKDLADYRVRRQPARDHLLTQAARAHAFLRHRGFVTPEDVKAVAFDVLRHRVSLTYEAEAEELTPEQIIQRVLRPHRSAVSATPCSRRSSSSGSASWRSAPARWSSDMLAGQYHSVFKGRGMAFSEVRQYQPGDDIRTIDWNVTARMNDAVRQGLHRGARAHGDAAGRRVGLEELRLARARPRPRWPPRSPRRSPSRAIANNDRVGLILFSRPGREGGAAAKGRKHVLRAGQRHPHLPARRAAARTCGAGSTLR